MIQHKVLNWAREGNQSEWSRLRAATLVWDLAAAHWAQPGGEAWIHFESTQREPARSYKRDLFSEYEAAANGRLKSRQYSFGVVRFRDAMPCPFAVLCIGINFNAWPIRVPVYPVTVFVLERLLVTSGCQDVWWGCMPAKCQYPLTLKGDIYLVEDVAIFNGCKLLNVIIGPLRNVKAKCPFSRWL